MDTEVNSHIARELSDVRNRLNDLTLDLSQHRSGKGSPKDVSKRLDRIEMALTTLLAPRTPHPRRGGQQRNFADPRSTAGISASLPPHRPSCRWPSGTLAAGPLTVDLSRLAWSRPSTATARPLDE
jgi:hypothetical protein